MDDEAQEALEMSKEELEARWKAGKPARVRHRQDVNQLAASVVEKATQEPRRIRVELDFQRVGQKSDQSVGNRRTK